jgi:ribosomal protein S18 acetylase RimI-like enzyme
MTVSVVPLAPDRWREAGEMMGRAFADDATRAAMFPDPGSRVELIRLSFQMGVRQALVDGASVDTTPSLSAVAVWFPPGGRTRPSLLSTLANARLSIRFVRLARLSGFRRAMGVPLRYERRHNRLMPRPHWYLEMLGVEPSRQRFGLGGVLVRHGLQRADADRVPVFVETETAANAAFYSKLGFQTLEFSPAENDPLDIATWCMLREPQPTDHPAPAATTRRLP